MEYVACNAMVGVVSVVYVVTGREELFFLTMVASGLHRCMDYTVPFLMAVRIATVSGLMSNGLKYMIPPPNTPP